MWNPEKHTRNENEVYFKARAAEWAHFPLFASQIIVPALMLFLPWWVVIVCIAVLDLLWALFREKNVSASIAHVFWTVNKFKFPVFIAFGVYYIWKSRWIEAGISFLWPFFAFVLAFIGPKADYGIIAKKMEEQSTKNAIDTKS